MWPVPFLIEGVVIGVLVSELYRRKLLWPVFVGVMIIALLLTSACASKPRPEPTKAMRWQGACVVCEVQT